ncbi:MAG: Nramp family divalent metal transporter [Saprospiraceae bacterium]|nr:Nramp family divalent metal transporter [Saprospiraceae bacterium]
MRSRRWHQLGPSLITAALIFGPGSLVINIKLGSQFGYSTLWVLVVSLLFMIAYTRLAARIGLTLNRSLLGELRGRYGRWITGILGIGIFFITCSFQAGNSTGMGLSLSALTGYHQDALAIAGGLLALGLLLFKRFYAILEKIMLSMVALMILSFLLTVMYTAPNALEIVKGLIPKVPTGSEVLLTALLATSFSVVAAFYQAYLVREKGWKSSDIPMATSEATTGIIILGTIAALVMVCAGATLHDQAMVINTPADYAKAIEPLFGSFSARVFMLGFLGASFSSMLGNATIGGGLLADGLGMGKSLDDRSVRAFIALIIIVGVVIAVLLGQAPLRLIIFAQAVTIFIAPLAAIVLLVLGFYTGILQGRSIWGKLVLALGLLALLVLAARNFENIFLP